MIRIIYIIILSLLMISQGCKNGNSEQTDRYKKLRQRMVQEQIINRGIEDERVIDALLEIERHMFVPGDQVEFAYKDRPLPIGEGQTISQPYIVAYMTELLDLQKDEKVLEIGTGSGYQAAVLAKLCNEVYSIEINEKLGKRAIQLLDSLGFSNINTKIGDGYKGWDEHAPFDAIIVTCAPTSIPEPLQEQLAEGGRMIIPVGGRFVQHLTLLEKKNGEIIKQKDAPVLFVPMIDEDGGVY